MSTKAQLTASNDANVRNKLPKVLKVELADDIAGVINELFGFAADKDADQVFTVKNSNFTYLIHVRKSGNKVHLTGNFTNISGNTLYNAKVFEIAAGEFLPASLLPSYGTAVKVSNGTIITMKALNTGIFCAESIGFNTGAWNFSITYNVAN